MNMNDSQCRKIGKFGEIDIERIVEEQTYLKLKKLEKKMKKYFSRKLENLQEILLKPKKHKKSKSPSARTPIELSNMSSYEVESFNRPLSQFIIEDSSISRNQYSTILKDSKNTTTSNPYKKGSKKASKKRSKK